MLSKEIETFFLVAKLKSFSKAAEMLFLSTPAIARQIGALEQEVGAPLFNRTNKGVSLTPAGESFYADAEKLVKMSDDARHRARISAGILENTITIGAVCSESNRIIPNVSHAFQQQCPDIELRFCKTGQLTMADDLRTRTIDLCFVYGKRGIKWEGISYYPIVQDVVASVVPASHRLATNSRIFLADFRGEQIIFGEEEEGDSEFHNRLRRYIMDHEPDIRLRSVPRDMTLANLILHRWPYVSVCARLCTPVGINTKIKPFEDDPPIEIGLLCRKENSPAIKEFLGIAKSTLVDILSKWQYD